MKVAHSSRLLRTTLVVVSLPVAAFLFALVAWMSVIVVAVAYSGSTGMPKTPAFVDPLISFIAGAIAASWLAALLMAVSRMERLLIFPILVTGAAGGLISLIVPSVAKLLLSVAPMALAVVKYVFAYRPM